MASTDLTVRIVLFSLIVNVAFPVFAYGFTTITGEALEDYDISISQQTLINAGLQFVDAQSLNISYGEVDYDSQTFNISDQLFRIRWDDYPGFGDLFQFNIPSIIEPTPFVLGGQILKVESNGLSYFKTFYNSSMVLNFDPAYNWTQIYVPQKGLIVLFTTLAADDNNITKAVYETGILTATVGERFTEDQGFDFRAFIDWYFGMLFTSKNYGLPSVANWIMRLFVAVTLFSAFLLARDLLPF